LVDLAGHSYIIKNQLEFYNSAINNYYIYEIQFTKKKKKLKHLVINLERLLGGKCV